MQRYFSLVIHCHQPIGNFHHVFEDAYKVAYLPFIELLLEHKNIKCALHYSGILYEWFSENHPEFLELLLQLVKRGQVELLCGGFYEPILSAIPDEDKILQIKKHREYIIKKFDTNPLGFWTAERVWEPHFAKYIYEAGARYTFLDDTHFKHLGMDEEALSGCFITEEDGREIGVFPISKKMRYLVPFSPSPLDVIEYIRKKREGALILYGDDGEKFGLWPGTHDWVWNKKWLKNFFNALEASDDIMIVTPKEWFFEHKAEGRVYLPTASYDEMMEWALPAEVGIDYQRMKKDFEREPRYQKFLKGAHWRNFLIKYEEANILQKKMFYLSERARKLNFYDGLEEVLKAQCNCGMWHGVFGGLYLPHLRNALHKHLIKAEKILYEREGKKGVCIDVKDFDKDGEEELIFETPSICACIKKDGGRLLWLDDKKKEFNILDVLTRRLEAYHFLLKNAKKEAKGVKSIHDVLLVKDETVADLLYYDLWVKNSLLNYFLPYLPKPEEFYKANIKPILGPSFPFSYKLLEDGVEFFCIQKVNEVEVSLRKSIYFDERGILVKYKISSSGRSVFCTEFNILPPSYKASYIIDGKKVEMEKVGGCKNIHSFILRNEELLIKFTLSPFMDVSFYPIYTASLSEAGIEKTFQGVSIIFSLEEEFIERECAVSISLDTQGYV